MKKSLLGATAVVLVLPVSLLLGKGTGVLPGELGIPINLNTGFPSCGTAACHNPFPNFNVKFEVTSPMSVRPGAAVPISAKVSGANSTVNRGGFSLEATTGSFTVGPNTRTALARNGRHAITHTNSLQRNWSFTYNATSTPGLVRLFGTANAANGDGLPGGDAWGWHGHDGGTPGNPHRVFVNASQIFPFGTSCKGDKDYLPVVGMPNNAAINTTFQTEVHGVPPLTASVVIMGFSNTTWGVIPLPLNLTLFNAPGCFLRVSMDVLNPVITSGSGPGMGVGKATWAIPNVPGLRGFNLFFQAMTVDGNANGLGLSFSMGLRAPIQ